MNVLFPDWLALNEADPDSPDPEVLRVKVPLLTVGIVGNVASVPSPLIYCDVLPPGTKACVCESLETEFVDASVILPGVPSVIDGLDDIAPPPVRPFPADTELDNSAYFASEAVLV